METRTAVIYAETKKAPCHAQLFLKSELPPTPFLSLAFSNLSQPRPGRAVLALTLFTRSVFFRGTIFRGRSRTFNYFKIKKGDVRSHSPPNRPLFFRTEAARQRTDRTHSYINLTSFRPYVPSTTPRVVRSGPKSRNTCTRN